MPDKNGPKVDAMDLVTKFVQNTEDGEQKTVLVVQPDRMMDSLRKSIDGASEEEQTALALIAILQEDSSKAGKLKIETHQRQLDLARRQREKYEAVFNRLMDATIAKIQEGN